MIILREQIREQDIKVRIEQIKKELDKYSEENGLKGLEDCIKRGLYVTGMMAVKEIRILVEELCMKLNAQMTGNSTDPGVEDIILEVHKFGPWDLIDKLQ